MTYLVSLLGPVCAWTMIDGNGLIYTLLAILFWGACFNIPFCKDRLLLASKLIELLAANTFITVVILFPEYCLEVIALILEDIRGLVARFDNGDTPILFAQRTAIPSRSHQRPDLYSVYLECYCHIPLLKQHDARTGHQVLFDLSRLCSIAARLSRFPWFQHYAAQVSLESCCTYCDAFRCAKCIFRFPLRTNQLQILTQFENGAHSSLLQSITFKAKMYCAVSAQYILASHQ